MKKTLITAIALAACVGTQSFAQNTKEDVMTFNLSRSYQVSVSDSSAANSGLWTAPPLVYKTKTSKLNNTDILKAISIVLYGSPSTYSSKAKLVLVQGELGGFFGLRQLLENNPMYTNTVGVVYTNHPVTPAYLQYTYVNTNAETTTFSRIHSNPVVAPWVLTATNTVPAVTNSVLVYGQGQFFAGGSFTTWANLEPRLATGRHYEANPDDARLAPGHDQPWGQVFVKDTLSGGAVLCDNVTFFFNFHVVECYDCFYLSSFISDSKFVVKARSGPPCCAGSSANSASGKDKYFLELSFDNTIQNPYLDSSSDLYVGWAGGKYAGIEGLYELDNGVDPDALAYDPSIISNVSNPIDAHDYDPYVMRFSLGGIVTYTWSLKLVNSNDSIPDFVGSASYPAYGYGYVGKVCSLLTGTSSFAESIKKSSTCCLDLPWYDSWYGVGFGYAAYGPSEVNFETSLSSHY